MKENKISEKVMALIEKQIDKTINPALVEVAPEKRLTKDLRLDSLDRLGLAIIFEKEFGIAIRNEEEEKLSTVQDAIDLVAEKVIMKTIAEKLERKIENVTPDKRFIEDLGGDSIDRMEIALTFENMFGIEITNAEEENIKTVRDIMNLVNQKTQPLEPLKVKSRNIIQKAREIGLNDQTNEILNSIPKNIIAEEKSK